jgi:predicted O-methyltransferase YrrM
MEDIYEKKYKTELDLIKKYIKNDIIYDIILKYESNVDGKIVKLRSNINVHEMVFVAILIDIYKCKNTIEIGCANGVSGMVMLNQICLSSGGGSLISIDPFQTVQWSNVGKYNINRICQHHKDNNVVSKHDILEEYSSDVLKKFIKSFNYFDCIFIDGSHAFTDVIIDIFCSIKLLKKNGIMIIDDVLHSGVKLVIDELINFKNIQKIHLDKTDDKITIVNSSYVYKSYDKSYLNPRTMFAYVKL